jgi:translation initiation factor IF-2
MLMYLNCIGKIHTLRHLKKDILEAGKGLECGIALEGWDDLREGDVIQIFEEISKPAPL